MAGGHGIIIALANKPLRDIRRGQSQDARNIQKGLQSIREVQTMELNKIIRDIPDFPQKGVLFRDITPLLHNPQALRETVDQMCQVLSQFEFDYVVGPESRGFIFGVPLAYAMNKGFIPIRKKGKLPYETLSREYSLEYGTAVLEMHADAIRPGQKVVIVDDLIATGGTSKAIVELIEEAGGQVVNLMYLIELVQLGGREMLKGYDVKTLIQY